jgi:hypothetical protein
MRMIMRSREKAKRITTSAPTTVYSLRLHGKRERLDSVPSDA